VWEVPGSNPGLGPLFVGIMVVIFFLVMVMVMDGWTEPWINAAR
jgi:hypothetical protein